ncbi:MAG: ComF family protein [Candidatus Omnitrophica bacterium]|nr:ComF family protein [Candidatus Omnitrophota bacterium]
MLRSLLGGLVEIVYPRVCLICQKKLKNTSSIDNLVCLECWQKIKRNLPPFCFRCGRHLEKKDFRKNICSACIRQALHFDRAFSPCVYDGVIKELIQAFKYQGKDYLGVSLSKLMTEFIREYNLPMEYIDLIIPVPLHKTRLREREFNQAEVLSNCIAQEFNKQISTENLMRHKHTRTQTELAPQERLSNVRESFRVEKNEEIKGKNILLVDDVLTTGATASWASAALKDCGANIVFVLTLAN